MLLVINTTIAQLFLEAYCFCIRLKGKNMKILNILATIFTCGALVLLILHFTSGINMLYSSSSLILGSLFLIFAGIKRKQAMQNVNYDNTDELEYDDYSIER